MTAIEPWEEQLALGDEFEDDETPKAKAPQKQEQEDIFN